MQWFPSPTWPTLLNVPGHCDRSNKSPYHPSVIFQKPIHGTKAFSPAGIDNPSDGLRAGEKGLAAP
jgi:hypothetical protein